MKIKFNWTKIGSYFLGALIGGGLTALGWKLIEGGGNPFRFRKVMEKQKEMTKTYYNPETDPDLDIDDVEIDPDIAAEIEGKDEDEEDDDPEPEIPLTHAPPKREPYKIDSETWYHSEEYEGRKHGRLTYYTEDGFVADENDELVTEPWKILGITIYEELSDPNGDFEIYVRNDDNGYDYAVSKEEGSFN